MRLFSRLVTLFAAGLAWLVFAEAARAEQRLRLIVQSGEHTRHDCPLTVVLPREVAQLVRDWRLWDTSEEKPVPVPSQFLGQDHSTLAWILAGVVPPKTIRRFELRPAKGGASPHQAPMSSVVNILCGDSSWDLRIGQRPVLRYHHQRTPPPDDIDPRYARSGYIHPVWTPAGEIVSDEFPPDHAHQSGIFLAHVKTEFEDRTPDFWNVLAGSGFVRSDDVVALEAGDVCGGFRVRHQHVDNSVDRGKIALNESWDVRVWQASGEHGWRFDITSTIACATDSPVVLKQYHYGGMAFRGGRSWVGDDALFTTSEGKTRDAGNHTRVPWVDLSGKTGGRWSGLTVFTDPANFRFPEPARLHPKMPYFVFSPAVLGDWAITPGRPHVSRYHYHVHDGPLSRETTERVWQEISAPPLVAINIVNE
jgi:hypothetical protein